MKNLKVSLLLITSKLLSFIDGFFYYIETSFYGLMVFLTVTLSVATVTLFLTSYAYAFSITDVEAYLVGTIYKPTSTRLGINGVLGANTNRELPFIKNKNILDPTNLTSKSALVVDNKTGKVLFGLNEHLPLAPASTTKLMTALVSLNIYSLSDKLKVPEICTTIDSSRVGLLPGESYTVSNLLRSLLIVSAGDSACVLSMGKMSYNDFVTLMNTKVEELGLKDTHFSNPIGLDGANKDNYSTAYDLYSLARVATSNSFIAETVKTKEYLLPNSPKNTVPFANTNKLLWEIPETIGVKTGTTAEAGEVLIYEYKKDEIDLMIVVLGSQDRFADTKTLLSWTLSKYSWDVSN